MAKKHNEGKLYLLQASWMDESREYRHRLIHTRAHSVEGMFEILADEHPDWATNDDYTAFGKIGGRHTSVTVFETVSMDCDSWRLWVRKQQADRREQIMVEERDRDMKIIQDLVAKHGLNAIEVLALAAT